LTEGRQSQKQWKQKEEKVKTPDKHCAYLPIVHLFIYAFIDCSARPQELRANISHAQIASASENAQND